MRRRAVHALCFPPKASRRTRTCPPSPLAWTRLPAHTGKRTPVTARHLRGAKATSVTWLRGAARPAPASRAEVVADETRRAVVAGRDVAIGDAGAVHVSGVDDDTRVGRTR